MSIVVQDLTGLNPTEVKDMPIVVDEARSRAAASGATSCSVAGLRHSQGAHTALSGGRMLLTETYNRVHGVTELPDAPGRAWSGLVEVDAGATWSDVQRAVAPYWLAPMVQQSSAHFSVGGSLSVNCHGRDPRWGPLSSTVEEITVLTGLGTVERASRTVNADLFRAALGGYGACGQILRATLRATRNLNLQYIGGEADIVPLAKYAARLSSRLATAPAPDIHMHYGWLCCVSGSGFYGEVLHVDMKPTANNARQVQTAFPDEAWGTGELLRAGWAASRMSPDIKALVWKELKASHRGWGGSGDMLNGVVRSRIDWLRSSVSFTALKGDTAADILQEYFVPASQFAGMVAALRSIYMAPGCPVNVLSTTVRVVQRDAETALSYCPAGPMVCIAVDAHVPLVRDGAGQADLHPQVKACIEACIAAALAHQGSYYLPYSQVASPASFRQAYPAHATLQQAIDQWNPKVGGRHRYWNRFLDAYFS
jgi:FAD/FMN-containing dehydrogenase